MQMTNLKNLHLAMINIQTDIQQFQVKSGVASFDCLFSTRETPFILSLTSRGENPKFFKFEVKNGYWIQPYFDKFYYDLVTVLQSEANTGIKLQPKEFLGNLNIQIPQKASKNNIPDAKQIISLRLDLTEDREKPYFDTWIIWKSKDKHGPSKENMLKTLVVFGKDALEYSKTMNASGRWSSKDLNRNWKTNKSSNLIKN